MTDISDEEMVKRKGFINKYNLLLATASTASIIGTFYFMYNNNSTDSMDVELAYSSHTSFRSLEEVSFVPTQSLSIVLPRSSNSERTTLRFEAQLEVPKQFEEKVTEAMPRITDVLNTYLRAVDVRDLENASMLPELRSQMLRRIRVATDESIIHDLLIQTLIVN